MCLSLAKRVSRHHALYILHRVVNSCPLVASFQPSLPIEHHLNRFGLAPKESVPLSSIFSRGSVPSRSEETLHVPRRKAGRNNDKTVRAVRWPQTANADGRCQPPPFSRRRTGGAGGSFPWKQPQTTTIPWDVDVYCASS